MFLASDILFMFAETPIHTGMGSGLGAVDLPLQRERQTGYPIVQSSGVKGALRQYAPGDEAYPDSEDNHLIDKTAVFGPRDTPDHGGALAPEDARLLLFPVRALNGVFVWITCHDVLWRFSRAAEAAGYDHPALPAAIASGKALVSAESLLLDQQYILLEEFEFEAQVDDNVQEWAEYLSNSVLPATPAYEAWKQRLINHFVVLPNDDYRDFVRYAMEVVTRIQLDPGKKTVKKGALFTQELLPTDSLLYTTVHATTLRTDKTYQLGLYEDPHDQAWAVLDWLRESVRSPIQIGGDETIGRGIVQLQWLSRSAQ